MRNSFIKVNCNPKNKKTDDCVIRAIHHATGKKWESIAQDLFNNMLKTGYMFNCKESYTPYIESLGFKPCKVVLFQNHKPTVKEFADLYPNGTYILRVANHLVTVKDGFYLDSWDSGNKSVYKFWMKVN